MQRYIIDGYNVIYADPALRREMLADSRRGRDALLALLREWVGRRDVDVTVVFDGAGAARSHASAVPGRLRVVYSRRGRRADDVIVETVRRDPNPRGIIVVSSDEADIGRAVRDAGARTLGAGTFLGRLSRGARVHDGAGEGGEKPTHIDVDYWLRQFEKRRDDGA